MTFRIFGAGVAGLCAATALAARGARVEVIDPGPASRAASWLAGGMLAPWCEAENAPPEVLALGQGAVDWWADHVSGVARHGTLVVAPPRDRAELARFASRTTGHEMRHGAALAALEPDLADRFDQALFYPGEGHLDPRAALQALRDGLARRGVAFHTAASTPRAEAVIDCRGLAARDQLPLRAVRGEMLLLRCTEVSLSRPVRLLHPRTPIYIVPRGQDVYMVGATMVESDDPGPVTARAVMELLAAAYTLHPAFAEAQLLETGAGLRPAYADNLPRLTGADGHWQLNGCYRHGFLLAPALAEQLATRFAKDPAHAH